MRRVTVEAWVDRAIFKICGEVMPLVAINKLVAAASKKFREFGLVFDLKTILTWKPKLSGGNALDTEAALHELSYWLESSDESNIAIGFTDKALRTKQPGKSAPWGFMSGVADGLNGRVVVAHFDKDVVTTVLHELGHIFGAVHTDKKSIMHPRLVYPNFDKESRKIILANRDREF